MQAMKFHTWEDLSKKIYWEDLWFHIFYQQKLTILLEWKWDDLLDLHRSCKQFVPGIDICCHYICRSCNTHKLPTHFILLKLCGCAKSNERAPRECAPLVCWKYQSANLTLCDDIRHLNWTINSIFKGTPHSGMVPCKNRPNYRKVRDLYTSHWCCLLHCCKSHFPGCKFSNTLLWFPGS